MARLACVVALLFLCLAGRVSSAWAQNHISGVSTNPNPYTDGQSVQIRGNAHWSPTYYGVSWVRAEEIYIEIEGSNGYSDSSYSWVSGGSSWSPFTFSDSIAGSSSFGDVSYELRLWVWYSNYEDSQGFWEEPSGYANGYVSYTTPPVPSYEITYSGGWYAGDTTVHRWNQQLFGGSFGGTRVYEQAAGGGPDTCYFSGSELNPQESIPNPANWPVGSQNTWGPDYVGWLSYWVGYYRTQGRAPCQTTLNQRMLISWPSGLFEYAFHALKMGFTAISVWSERNGEYAEKVYP